jgi:hypothetical protein
MFEAESAAHTAPTDNRKPNKRKVQQQTASSRHKHLSAVSLIS